MDGAKQPEASSTPRQSKESLGKKVKRLEREQRRLRSTVSFQLGFHLTDAVRRPWRVLALPITFPLLAFKLGLQRLGKRPKSEDVTVEEVGNRKHSIILFPTNGVGFGHFTRMYAVARALRKADPDLEIVFFTPMPTLHVLYNEKFPTYHLAGRYMHKDMTSTQWNGLVEDMLHLVFDTHRPKWFMFDGAFPYRGMLNAIASQSGMQKWWMKRGSLKANTSVPVDSMMYFDGILVPSEGEENSPEHGEKVVSSICALDFEEVWGRGYARRRLSVPGKAKVVYVQLGAGRINEIGSQLEQVLDALFEHKDVFVVLGESMLGERLTFTHERLRFIRDYPNALYAKAFDASVQAGGYNSYQEMRMFGIPTLFLPNLETGMDDQLKRCLQAEKEGWGIVYQSGSEPVSSSIASLLDLEAKPKIPENGATEVVRILGIGSQ